ncbi:MAG TPA: prepilin-type N-terminal cleavage/methylation domain-containing protein [Candidatus Limnocylindrales bacterium]|nr:prepilin-type N-terminal cleavage/methylation domain-containing protein [Candidatus Limnocylindrales bacterium]
MSPVSAKPGLAAGKGFSLVEALVVVMVMLVIAAIAIPGFVHARMRANEASAVVSMKTIRTAEIMYMQTYPEIGYANSLGVMGTQGSTCENPNANAACIIMDDALASGVKNGYMFEVLGDGMKPSYNYTVNATPESSGVSGRCSFTSSETGEIMLAVAGTGNSQPGRFSLGSTGTCDH